MTSDVEPQARDVRVHIQQRGACSAGRYRARSGVMACACAVVLVGFLPAVSVGQARRWEMVSPVEKNGVDAVARDLTAFVSSDGDRATMRSNGGYTDAQSGGGNDYLATRGSGGWSTIGITPAVNVTNPVIDSSALVQAYSDDMSKAVLGQGRAELLPEVGPGLDRALYLWNATDRSLTWLTRPQGPGPVAGAIFPFAGASDDLRHVVFRGNPPAAGGPTIRMLPEDAGRISGSGVYEVADGQLKSVSILPDGRAPVNGAITPGTPTSDGRNLDFNRFDNQVSSDGSRIVFVSPDPSVPAAGPGQIYVRIDGERTVLASRSMINGQPSARTATFYYASSDGSRVWFETNAALTGDAPAGGSKIYSFDVDTEVVTYLPDGARPLVSSADGERFLYRKPGTNDLWLSDHGALVEVAKSVDTYLGLLIDGRQLRVSDDGNRFLFMSLGEVEPGRFNNSSGYNQAYLYDVERRELSCVSCPPAGMTATSDASIDTGAWVQRYRPSRGISTDGRRVVFDTTTAMVSDDVNRRRDVYEWADDGLTLISGGKGKEHSFVADISENGDDIFFITRNQLVSADVDGSADLYAARFGGGFPPPYRPPVCENDCQGPLTPPPFLPDPRTAVEEGDGNDHPTRRAESQAVLLNRFGPAALRSWARTGRIRLVARVTGSGTLRVIARTPSGSRWRPVARPTRSVRRSGRVALTLVLSKQAKRTLRGGKTLPITLEARFGRASATQAFVLSEKSRARTGKQMTKRRGASPNA